MTYSSSSPVLTPRKQNPRAGSARLFLPLSIIVWLLSCLPAMGVPPHRLLVAPPSAVISNDNLFLTLSLTANDEDGLRDLLKDGSVLRLGITVSISRQRSWWTDTEIARHEYASILRHDPLTRDFMVSLPAHEEEKILRDKNLTRLLHVSWRKLSLFVVSLPTLYRQESNEEFLIEFTLNLQHTEVPPWLEKNFLFWSPDIVPQEKHTLPFRLPTVRDHGN
ncbi:MAG: DUF4390 domain-containing protein [Desulfovibrio sp.]|nr:DUF4390 domain-containing protein [Desulfovibrio sp.]